MSLCNLNAAATGVWLEGLPPGKFNSGVDAKSEPTPATLRA